MSLFSAYYLSFFLSRTQVEVETGTPPFDTESGTQIPTNTGGQTREQPSARDYIMTAETEPSDRMFYNDRNPATAGDILTML